MDSQPTVTLDEIIAKPTVTLDDLIAKLGVFVQAINQRQKIDAPSSE